MNEAEAKWKALTRPVTVSPCCAGPVFNLGVAVRCEVGWDPSREESLMDCEIDGWACEACGGSFFMGPPAADLQACNVVLGDEGPEGGAR